MDLETLHWPLHCRSIFLNILNITAFYLYYRIDKMTAKSLKIEKNEDFISAWQDEPSLWDVGSPVYKDRSTKQQSLTKLASCLKCEVSIFWFLFLTSGNLHVVRVRLLMLQRFQYFPWYFPMIVGIRLYYFIPLIYNMQCHSGQQSWPNIKRFIYLSILSFRIGSKGKN